MKKFYLTTAIDYVNAKVHLGHALEKIEADVLARYQRSLKKEVFFLTGTDENAQKNVLAAQKAKVPVNKFVKENAEFAENLWKSLSISFDFFIRTTNKNIHWPGVKKLWLECLNSGDIYKKKYRGLYCTGCEAFLKEKDLKNGFCPYHGKRPKLVFEENYFFRLSKYQNRLERIIEKEEIKIFPKERKNEILNFIQAGLEDFSISRPRERMKGWGIPVPKDNSQIIYVWFDALANYISAIGYGRDENNFKKFWPADLHVIGKDILKFHAIYWPAILLSAKLPLPKAIFVHGFITVEGKKMSKTLGNIIDPLSLIEKYGSDSLRYYLLREASPFEDLDFTFEKFKKRYNFDLAFGLGNLVSRVLKLAKEAKIKKGKKNPLLVGEILKTKRKVKEKIEEFKFNEALASIWDLISFCDKVIQKEKPWMKLEKKEGKEIVTAQIFALKEISEMLKPFLPMTSEKILEKIETQNVLPLFPKIV